MTKANAPELYTVHRRIRYHNPDSPFNGKLIEPGSDEAKAGLPMDHLNDGPLNILIRKGYLKPKVAPKP